MGLYPDRLEARPDVSWLGRQLGLLGDWGPERMVEVR